MEGREQNSKQVRVDGGDGNDSANSRQREELDGNTRAELEAGQNRGDKMKTNSRDKKMPAATRINGLNTQQQQATSETLETVRIVAEQAGLAEAEQSERDNFEQKHGNHDELIRMAIDINEVAKMENCAKVARNPIYAPTSSEVTDSSTQASLIQMAIDINEAAATEKFAAKVARNPRPASPPRALEFFRDGNKRDTAAQTLRNTATQMPSSQREPDTTVANPPSQQRQQQQQPTRPGAYGGAPGEALQRATTLRFSLVGNYGEPLTNMTDPSTDSFTAQSHNNNNNSNYNVTTSTTISGRHLAVASLVLDDPSGDLIRPNANPVDTARVQERQRNKKRQKKIFIVFLITAISVAAIIVGTVIGTRKPTKGNSRRPSPNNIGTNPC